MFYSRARLSWSISISVDSRCGERSWSLLYHSMGVVKSAMRRLKYMKAFFGFACIFATETAESNSYVALSRKANLSRQLVRHFYSVSDISRWSKVRHFFWQGMIIAFSGKYVCSLINSLMSSRSICWSMNYESAILMFASYWPCVSLFLWLRIKLIINRIYLTF